MLRNPYLHPIGNLIIYGIMAFCIIWARYSIILIVCYILSKLLFILPNYYTMIYLNKSIITEIEFEHLFEKDKLYFLRIPMYENGITYYKYKFYCKGIFPLETYFKYLFINMILSSILLDIPTTIYFNYNITYKIVTRNMVNTVIDV